jgi:hypothetical protein
MNRPLRRYASLAATAALLAAAPALARAQETRSPDSLKGNGKAELASGVITKVEKAPSADKNDAGRVRLTINTAAVWSDWVRDQATAPAKATAKPDVPQKDNSVATKGEPRTENTLVLVDVGPDTKTTLRFRSSADEATKGSATPEGAARTDPPGGDAKVLKVDELKPGLFVQVEFRHDSGRHSDKATRVVVLKPVGGPDSAAKDTEVKKTSGK